MVQADVSRKEQAQKLVADTIKVQRLVQQFYRAAMVELFQLPLGGQRDVGIGDGPAALEGGVGAGRLQNHQVGAVAVHLERGGELGDGEEIALGVGHTRQRRTRLGQPLNPPDWSTLYTLGEKGYNDYPALA